MNFVPLGKKKMENSLIHVMAILADLLFAIRGMVLNCLESFRGEKLIAQEVILKNWFDHDSASLKINFRLPCYLCSSKRGQDFRMDQ